ncbi:MAG: 2-isopropylmalate synthase [Candidatus Micrarchaeota archaeon]
MKNLLVLDTTLRDGEQTPGLSLSSEKKLLIARKLDEVGVDIIEAGSACASEGERESIKKIANEKLNAEISSFCRGVFSDIDAALSCDVTTVSLVIPASDLHITQKLKKTRPEVLELTKKCTDYARSHGLIVELLAEDGSRADHAFLRELFSSAIKAGASRVCVCDTVGVLTPESTTELYKKLTTLKAPVAFHGHNDLGLAVANTLAAVRAGAREIHCTVNGLGERAGNAPLEEVAVCLEYFYKQKLLKTKKLYELSSMVEKLSGIELAHNKPLVGRNAFAHESGIHVDGIIKCASTYEPISPELIGQRRRITLGKHSGKKAIQMKLDEMGVKTSAEQIDTISQRVKELGDKGKEVTDADFEVIAYDVLNTKKEARVKLLELTAITGNNITPTASVKLSIGNEEKLSAGIGDGPVDAAINAIENALGGTGVKLTYYHVDAITGGANALVDVHIRLRKKEREVSASAAGTDIVMASVQAMLKGLNVLL